MPFTGSHHIETARGGDQPTPAAFYHRDDTAIRSTRWGRATMSVRTRVPGSRGERRHLPASALAIPLATGVIFVTLILAPLYAAPLGPLVTALGVAASVGVLLGAVCRGGGEMFPRRASWGAIGILLALGALLLAPYPAAPAYFKMVGALYLGAAFLAAIPLVRAVERASRPWWHPRLAGVGVGAFAVAALLLSLAFWYLLNDL